MSELIETFLAALLLSGLACACLALLPNAPPRVRFVIAIAGLSAWLVPWAWIRIPLAQTVPLAQAIPLLKTLPFDGALLEPLERIAALGGATSAGGVVDTPAVLVYAVAALFLAGVALFVRDWLALQRCVRRWRAASRPGDALRALLPPELRGVAAEIRIVRGSRAAAASGWLTPTVWIGDRHTGAALELVLLHEMWHARRRDPLRLALIAAVRRAYWWNPLVAHLARQAVLMLESSCDHRCAEHLGRSSYIAELAALMLHDGSPAPSTRLLAAARSASFNVARIELLGRRLRLRARDAALIAALSAAGTLTAAASVVEVAIAGVDRGLAAAAVAAAKTVATGGNLGAAGDSAGAPLPRTPAGRALETMLRAVNAGDTELLSEILGAYTPQELPLPFPSGSGELRVVEVLRSEPLRIEYVVAAGGRDVRRIGEIEVADSAARRITSSRLRELP